MESYLLCTARCPPVEFRQAVMATGYKKKLDLMSPQLEPGWKDKTWMLFIDGFSLVVFSCSHHIDECCRHAVSARLSVSAPARCTCDVSMVSLSASQHLCVYMRAPFSCLSISALKVFASACAEALFSSHLPPPHLHEGDVVEKKGWQWRF